MKGNIKNIEITGIQAAVPCNEVDNMQYISQLSNHRIKKQIELTGIKKRRVTLEKQKASDLATEAAKKLMKTLKWKETEVEVLIFVTQSPDLQRPSTAFLIQNRLGLSSKCMVYDINFGCNGMIVGLITLGSILQTTKGKGLLLLGESNALEDGTSINQNSLLRGDAAAAIALQYTEKETEINFEQFSDGSRANLLYKTFENPGFMDGNGVFIFGISDVVKSVKMFMEREKITMEQVDYFVFHQAQKMIVEGISQEIGIPQEKVLHSCENFGNTSSASIPLTMCSELGERDQTGKIKVLLCGYGIGLSWGIIYTTIEKESIYPLMETDYIYDDRKKFYEA